MFCSLSFVEGWGVWLLSFHVFFSRNPINEASNKLSWSSTEGLGLRLREKLHVRCRISPHLHLVSSNPNHVTITAKLQTCSSQLFSAKEPTYKNTWHLSHLQPRPKALARCRHQTHSPIVPHLLQSPPPEKVGQRSSVFGQLDFLAFLSGSIRCFLVV